MHTTRHAVLPAAVLLCAAALVLTVLQPSHSSQAAAPDPDPGSPAPGSAQSTDAIASAVPDCQVSSGFPDAVLQWCPLITRSAASAGLEPDLVAAVMLLESSGNPQAISANGAVGLLQVMPRDGPAAEFTCPNGPCFAARPTTQELLDPEYNLEYGTRLLSSLLERTISLREALLHYGPIDVGYTYADTVLQMRDRYTGTGRVME